MSRHGKRDILLHYDEENNEIIFYTVASERTSEMRKSEFDGARSDIVWFQAQSPDEAENSLGSMVFSLIDTFSEKKIGIRDYEALNQEAHRAYVKELEIEAKAKDPDALYSLFIEWHSKALREKSLNALEDAERLLKESAALGCKEAIDRLENDWGLMLEAARRRIRSARNT